MARPWSKEEEKHLLDVMLVYRESIQNKNIKEVRRITKQIAGTILNQHPILQGRTVTAIYERLPYLDNLLAGVYERTHYSIKDQPLYGTMPRENRDPNMCNTRHSYLGAVREKAGNKKK